MAKLLMLSTRVTFLSRFSLLAVFSVDVKALFKGFAGDDACNLRNRVISFHDYKGKIIL